MFKFAQYTVILLALFSCLSSAVLNGMEGKEWTWQAVASIWILLFLWESITCQRLRRELDGRK